MKQTTQQPTRQFRCCFFSYDENNSLNNTNNETKTNNRGNK